MNRRSISDLAVACLFIVVGVVSRLMPHPPNFTAVSALALFAGFYFANWKLGPVVTLITLFVSDLFAGAYDPRLMAAVYIASLTPLILGRLLRGGLMTRRVVCCALCSSVAFFLTTNFAVWLFSTWYSSDWNGLVACYVAAIPFFRYTLSSDLVFSSLLFGGYALALHGGPRLAASAVFRSRNGTCVAKAAAS